MRPLAAALAFLVVVVAAPVRVALAEPTPPPKSGPQSGRQSGPQSGPKAPAPTTTSAPAGAPAEAKPAGKPALQVLLDDRDVKDQAPRALLDRVAAELMARNVAVVWLTAAAKAIPEGDSTSLARCDDDGCLAAAAAGGALCKGRCDEVVSVRLTLHDSARLLAVTRTNALRPQISDDAGVIVDSEKDALKAVPEAIGDLFPALARRAP